jgi:hypothetical protein
MLIVWHIAGICIIATLLLGNGTIQSQPPATTPLKYSTDQKTHSAATNEKTAPNPTGTDKQPFVVKSLEAEKTPERSEQDRPEREEKSANERSLIVWTMVLGVATVVLAIIAGIQVGVFWVQLKLMRVAVSDGTLIAKTAREEFLATHRPRIRVRRIALSQDTKTGDNHVSFTIANVGGTIAHITGGMDRIEYRPKLLGLPNIQKPIRGGFPIGAAPLYAGAQNSYTIHDEAVMVDFQFERGIVADNRMKRLYCYGFIVYTDNLGTIRETGFCRVFEGDSFIRINNPDYEYED